MENKQVINQNIPTSVRCDNIGSDRHFGDIIGQTDKIFNVSMGFVMIQLYAI